MTGRSTPRPSFATASVRGARADRHGRTSYVAPAARQPDGHEWSSNAADDAWEVASNVRRTPQAGRQEPFDEARRYPDGPSQDPLDVPVRAPPPRTSRLSELERVVTGNPHALAVARPLRTKTLASSRRSAWTVPPYPGEPSKQELRVESASDRITAWSLTLVLGMVAVLAVFILLKVFVRDEARHASSPQPSMTAVLQPAPNAGASPRPAVLPPTAPASTVVAAPAGTRPRGGEPGVSSGRGKRRPAPHSTPHTARPPGRARTPEGGRR